MWDRRWMGEGEEGGEGSSFFPVKACLATEGPERIQLWKEKIFGMKLLDGPPE
jgi:hypothetical protein